MAGDGSSWTFYSTNNETLYVPELPGDLTQLTWALTFLNQTEAANVKLFDYSEVNNYQDALDILLDNSKEFNYTTNTFYTTVRKTIDFVNNN